MGLYHVSLASWNYVPEFQSLHSFGWHEPPRDIGLEDGSEADATFLSSG